jgi:hypothetical protein
MKITLNAKPAEVAGPLVATVRSLLPPEQSFYIIYRENCDKPDELVKDTALVCEGDRFYCIPFAYA